MTMDKNLEEMFKEFEFNEKSEEMISEVKKSNIVSMIRFQCIYAESVKKALLIL